MSPVPKLRFHEFNGEWEENTLGDYFEFKNGLNSDKSSYGSGTKFINVLDILSEKPITYKSIIGSVTVTDKEFEKSRVTYGDILFQRSSETREEVGLSNVYLDKDRDCVFGGFVIRGSPKQKIIPEFVNAALMTATVRKDITSRSGGSTRYNIGQESLAKVIFVHPLSLPEQKKIASFLSSVDKKIDLLRQKKDALELYKKGLMQKIFSQEIRFKQDDGSDFPEWEEVALGEGLYKPRNVAVANSYGKKITVQLNLGGVTLRQEIRDYEGGEKTKYFERSAGDFIYGKQNFHKGAFGIIPETLGGFYSSSDLPCLSFKGYIFEPRYLLYFLSTFYETFEAFTSGTGSKRLKEETLLGMSFEFPSLAEQEKIASFLSAVDTKIQKTLSQIEQMETFKKGLLQQMFV